MFFLIKSFASRSLFQSKHILVLACCGMIALAPGKEAEASIYDLFNHPNGNAEPPKYGFRLDELQGANTGDYTFSFEGNGAAMQLEFDTVAETIRIFGTAFGGRDTGNSYDSDNSGLWSIDFTYAVNVVEASGGYTVSPESPLNNGTVSLLSGNWLGDATTVYNLTDYQGSHNDSFLFLPDGHRIPGDNTTFVGRGWVNHDGNGMLSTHDTASDWLFTGKLVPEASSIVTWFLLGLASLGLVWYRRKRA